MSETLKIEKEKVLKASEECEEFKGIAEKLWPEIFEEEWEDITDKVKWELRKSSDSYLLEVFCGKDFFGHLWADGEYYIVDNNYKIEKSCDDKHFRILKKK